MEEAEAFEPKQTKNVSDLDRIPTDIEVEDDSFPCKDKETGEQKTVHQKVVVVDDVKYRVPGSVLGALKQIKKLNPNLKYFKVARVGTGQYNTQYTVVQLGDSGAEEEKVEGTGE